MVYPFPRPFPGPSILKSFTVLSLFSSGEQGAWYDPSDFSTMFQDAAGTTPVTAVEQPVGLLLDKSKGLALGSERITNGGFDSTAWWGVDAGWSISGGVATNTGADQIYTPLTTLEANKRYEISFDVTSVTTSGALVVVVGVTNVSLTVASTGRYTLRAADATGGRLRFGSGTGHSWRGSIDNVTVKEIPGNHASQSTAASRPVLSARVNQVEFSEQFDNAYWAKDNFTVANTTATTDPLGGTTADVCTPTAVGASHRIYKSGTAQVTATSCTYSLSVKANGYTKIGIRESATSGAGAAFDLSGTGSVIGAYNAGGSTVSGMAITPTGNNWFRIVLTISFASATAQTLGVHALSPSYTAGSTISESWLPNGTDGYYIWGADLRSSNVGVNLPAYQRVGAAVSATTNPAVTGVPDYDTSGFPLYLKFDGVDDSLATGTIDPGAVDKAQVFAGVRKLQQAAVGIIAELSVDVGSNNGTLTLNDRNSATYAGQSKGTISSGNVSPTGTYTAPVTSTLTLLGDISADTATMRANGGNASTVPSDQGTGNYLAYPLYIGRRGGSSLPFNGQLYSMILRFSAANLSDAQIASTETYVNSKTGAY